MKNTNIVKIKKIPTVEGNGGCPFVYMVLLLVDE